MKIGQKVWYSDGRQRLAAVITGFGEKDGEQVVDVSIEGETDKFERDRWGYIDQIKAR